MGADTTSTHLIFFIATTVVATAAAGTLTGVVLGVSDEMNLKGASVEGELSSAIAIVNDPRLVITSPNALFYVKNVGSTTLESLTLTAVLDGRVVATYNTLLNGEQTFRPGAVLQVQYNSTISAGDHTFRVSMEHGAHASMTFRK